MFLISIACSAGASARRHPAYAPHRPCGSRRDPALLTVRRDAAEGADSSCSSSRRFEVSTPEKVVTPVRLPFGWLRRVTRSSVTGSPLIKKTMGILVVAVLAACAASALATAIAATPY